LVIANFKIMTALEFKRTTQTRILLPQTEFDDLAVELQK
jgi:hypothetical protein